MTVDAPTRRVDRLVPTSNASSTGTWSGFVDGRSAQTGHVSYHISPVIQVEGTFYVRQGEVSLPAQKSTSSGSYELNEGGYVERICLSEVDSEIVLNAIRNPGPAPDLLVEAFRRLLEKQG